MNDSYQLIILGNGFDLHCGLRTSYKDFFEKEIMDMTTINFGIVKMKVPNPNFWKHLLFAYYQCNGNIDYKWCDIEKIIKNTLLDLFINQNNSLGKIIYLEAIEAAKEKFSNGTNQNISTDNKVEKFLFDYCVWFFYNNNPLINDNTIATELLIKHLLFELNLFENRFCRYIKNLIVNPSDNSQKNTDYIFNAINLLALIIGKPKLNFEYIKFSVDSINNNKLVKNFFYTIDDINILSFNYTSIIDLLTVGARCTYSNVHGKLCSLTCNNDCKYSNIIFGVDDNFVQSHNKIQKLRFFSKTFRKMLSESIPKNILPPNNGINLKIKFYGHSLSEADYSYFQSIFDYYNIYSNTNVILIFYYSTGFEQFDAIYDLINAYGKTLSNKDQGKNLTHKLLLENRLKIVEID